MRGAGRGCIGGVARDRMQERPGEHRQRDIEVRVPVTARDPFPAGFAGMVDAVMGTMGGPRRFHGDMVVLNDAENEISGHDRAAADEYGQQDMCQT